MSETHGIARSRIELAAARLLADAGFAAQAISRAYYAGFYAAEAAIGALGETRSKHAGVIAAFEQLVVRTGHVDPEAGRLLRSLFRRRGEADYGAAPAELEDAEAALADAGRIVELVEEWLRTL